MCLRVFVVEVEAADRASFPLQKSVVDLVKREAGLRIGSGFESGEESILNSIGFGRSKGKGKRRRRPVRGGWRTGRKAVAGGGGVLDALLAWTFGL